MPPYITTDKISVRISIAWSWKLISWSIVGEAASWNRSCAQVDI